MMQIVTDAVSAGETRYTQVGNRLITITAGPIQWRAVAAVAALAVVLIGVFR